MQLLNKIHGSAVPKKSALHTSVLFINRKNNNMIFTRLKRILKFTFEHLLIKSLIIRSFGVSFQVTGFLVFTHILLKFYPSNPI